MNIPLLTDVKFNILAVPESFDIDNWFKDNESAPCGTTGCIAGHVVAIVKRSKTLAAVQVKVIDHAFHSQTREIAEDALGLSVAESQRLFFLGEWPVKYRCAYIIAKTPAQRARATANRIDWFIKTNGAE